MTQNIRGNGLVVTMTENRNGWRADIRALHKLFLYLNVLPKYLFDLTYQELIEEMHRFASDDMSKSVDCLFVVLMGHGGVVTDEKSQHRNKDYLRTSNGTDFIIREEIDGIFDNKKYPWLIDKPKLYFIQMCRGDYSEPGVSLDRKHRIEADASAVIRKVPPHSDYMFGFAAQPGTESYRHNINGSWYIQQICRLFMLRAAKSQVVNIMAEVTVFLQKMSCKIDKVQASEYLSGLGAPLYLFPGLNQKLITSFSMPPLIQHIHTLPTATEPKISRERLNDLQLEMYLKHTERVLPLSDGEAIVSCTEGQQEWSVVKIDNNGREIIELYRTDILISGFIQPCPSDLLVLEENGWIKRINITEGNIEEDYKVKVESLDDGTLDNDHLLLVDQDGGKIIKYSMTNRQQEDKLNCLLKPSSIAKTVSYNGVLYIVCESLGHRVNIYDSSWTKLTSIGEVGYMRHQFNIPRSVVVTDDQTLIIADSENHRLSEFSLYGNYIRYVLAGDSIYYPSQLSLAGNHLWVCFEIRSSHHIEFHTKRYQIYKNTITSY